MLSGRRYALLSGKTKAQEQLFSLCGFFACRKGNGKNLYFVQPLGNHETDGAQ